MEGCTGKKFLKTVLDIKYETMKILSKGDATVRQIMMDTCYVEAGEDEIKSYACDLFEYDVLDLLWNSLPFNLLIVDNSQKYLEIGSQM